MNRRIKFFFARRRVFRNRAPTFRDTVLLTLLALLATLIFSVAFSLKLDAAASALAIIGLSFFMFGNLIRVAGRWRTALLWLNCAWLVLFAFHLWLNGFLAVTYGLRADSDIILRSISNSQSDEFLEGFLHTAPWVLAVAAGGIIWLVAMLKMTLTFASRERRFGAGTPSRGQIAVTVCATLAFFAANFVPALRMANPIGICAKHLADYQKIAEQQESLRGLVNATRSRIPAWNPTYEGPPKSTFVFVIGESTSRFNWSLYGYARKTTPILDSLRGELVVFGDVISAGGSTVPSMERMLTGATMRSRTDFLKEPDVLLLAQAAGYKVFWLSNQNDRRISRLFAQTADKSVFINRGDAENVPLDEALFPAFKEALADPAPRKLIILHPMGAHPKYDRRVPEGFNAFLGADDEIEKKMEDLGRVFLVRDARASYDNAMLYQDGWLAFLLQTLREQAGKDGSSARFLYVSDHAQEVGHTRDFIGHDAVSFVGYSVPMFYWRNEPFSPEEKALLEGRAYQTDRLEHTLLPLLFIRTNFYRPEDDIFNIEHFAPQKRYLEYEDYVPGVPEV